MSLIKSILWTIGALLRGGRRRSKVLFYHDIHREVRYTDMSTPLELFCAHMAMVRRLGFEVVTQITKPYGQVKICFDDGWRGLFDLRREVAKMGVSPTVFVPVLLVGQQGYASKEEIQEWVQMGFQIEGHAWSHSDLTQFADDGLDRELVEAKRVLSEMTGVEVMELCYPIGYFSDKVIQAAKQAGYRRQYASYPAAYFCPNFDGVVGRYLVQYASPYQVGAILLGGMDVLMRYYIKRHKR